LKGGKVLVQGKNRQSTYHWSDMLTSAPPRPHLLREVGQYKREKGVKTSVKSTCILFPKPYKDHWDTTGLSAFHYSYH